jgi:hypothetical protein
VSWFHRRCAEAEAKIRAEAPAMAEAKRLAERQRFLEQQAAWAAGAAARDAAAMAKEESDFELAWERFEKAKVKFPELAFSEPDDAQDDPTPEPSPAVAQADGDSQATTGDQPEAPEPTDRRRVGRRDDDARDFHYGFLRQAAAERGRPMVMRTDGIKHLTDEQAVQFSKDAALDDARRAEAAE